jgi:hypothetical protein
MDGPFHWNSRVLFQFDLTSLGCWFNIWKLCCFLFRGWYSFQHYLLRWWIALPDLSEPEAFLDCETRSVTSCHCATVDHFIWRTYFLGIFCALDNSTWQMKVSVIGHLDFVGKWILGVNNLPGRELPIHHLISPIVFQAAHPIEEMHIFRHIKAFLDQIIWSLQDRGIQSMTNAEYFCFPNPREPMIFDEHQDLQTAAVDNNLYMNVLWFLHRSRCNFSMPLSLLAVLMKMLWFCHPVHPD